MTYQQADIAASFVISSVVVYILVSCLATPSYEQFINKGGQCFFT